MAKSGFIARVVASLAIAVTVSSCTATTQEVSPPEDVEVESNQTAAPLAGFTIAVDAGHNGGNADNPQVINENVDVLNGQKACDTTGTETNDGYFEHEFNFDVATRLVTSLESLGATVVVTRETDDGVGPCITERAAVANEAEADAAVSIHADGAPADGHGFHIMEPLPVDGHNDAIVEPSHELALLLADSYESGTGMPPSNYIGTDGINPRDDMGGLNLSTVPKVMMECGNMRHEGDAALLSDAEFRQSIAESLAIGLTAFLTG